MVTPLSEAEDQQLCDGPITDAECLSAVKDFKKCKTPGTDGFPAESFYQFFWPELRTEMLASFHFAFQSGSLSISQRRGVIALIPKKNKDKSILENLRPISLLNVDYKILTKVIAKRIEKTLPKIINTDQTGYVKGRYIGENIRLIQDVSAESKKAQDRWGKKEEKLLVQLWAEKHDQLESRESRKTWAWIAEKISKALGTNKTADKCMRKMKYIIERYKNAKDWNKNQTGGSLRKSVYYDEVDKILGCPDVVTFNHVAEAGISGDSATEVVTESSDINIGEISTSSRPNVSETPAEKR